MMKLLRRILQIPVTLDGLRLVDVIAIPAAIVVALVVLLPTLIVSILLGLGPGLVLKALGAPDSIVSIPILGGIGLGLVLGFVVLLRLYRRVPAAIRLWFEPDGPPDPQETLGPGD